ncbi:hypothetical protein [uncultured Variovorax sp.]|uniref:hypothetical protein n=1 Tax=uncultured Variovorax sp. TaxID=114708 RepID=UPI0025DDFC3A|nr:hypothetical protein [uncultured Variovorax sp.]
MPDLRDEFETYLFEYRFNGATWIVEIKATSPEEARIRARQPLSYVGEVQTKIATASIWARLKRLMGVQSK